jgi:hypothetical protein
MTIEGIGLDRLPFLHSIRAIVRRDFTAILDFLAITIALVYNLIRADRFDSV